MNDKKMENICVLGASGFIGRHLINNLEKYKNFYIRAMSRSKNKDFCTPDYVQWIDGDIRRLESLISFLVPNAIVINLVYLDEASEEDNVRAMDNLAEACITAGVARLIHCSTAVVAGNVKDDVITEETICVPANIYEKTKLKIENRLIERLQDKCEVVIARPTAVFGPNGKNGLKLINELISESRLIRLLKTSLHSRRKMNFVSVKNVVDAILYLSLFSGNIGGQCYIISDDEEKENNYLDISNLFAHNLGLRQVRTIYVPFQCFMLSVLLRIMGRTNINPNRTYSGHKLAQLGFSKSLSFNDAIQQFCQWYKSNLSNTMLNSK